MKDKKTFSLNNNCEGQPEENQKPWIISRLVAVTWSSTSSSSPSCRSSSTSPDSSKCKGTSHFYSIQKVPWSTSKRCHGRNKYKKKFLVLQNFLPKAGDSMVPGRLLKIGHNLSTTNLLLLNFLSSVPTIFGHHFLKPTPLRTNGYYTIFYICWWVA